MIAPPRPSPQIVRGEQGIHLRAREIAYEALVGPFDGNGCCGVEEQKTRLRNARNFEMATSGRAFQNNFVL